MKKILLGSLLLVALFSGCNKTYGELKRSIKDVRHERCINILNSVPDNVQMTNDSIVLMTLVITNCENTESILDAINKKRK